MSQNRCLGDSSLAAKWSWPGNLSTSTGPALQLVSSLYIPHIAVRIPDEFDKPNGLTGLSPSELPGRLLDPDIEDLPGVGKRRCVRLQQAGLTAIEKLRQAEPGWLQPA